MKMKSVFPLFPIFVLSLAIDFALGVLDSKDVVEGKCENKESDFARDIDMNFIAKIKSWHSVIASEHCFRMYAETFLGRPAKDEEELSKMCLHFDMIPINATSFSVTTYGYKNKLKQICSPTIGKEKQCQAVCDVVEVSPGTNTFAFDKDYLDFVILTDNKTFAAVALCLRGIRTYKVLSVSSDVPQSVIDQVKVKITSMGFKSEMMRHIPCSVK